MTTKKNGSSTISTHWTPNSSKSLANTAKRTLVFGCGYLGSRVANLAQNRGHQVFVTTRNREKTSEFAARGLSPVIADWTDRRTLRDLPSVDQVVVAVSYDSRSRLGRYESIVDGFSHLLRVLPPQVPLCYVSTTGVYHQTDGSWVDEASTTRPTRDGGAAHLMAESLLWRIRPKQPWTILRLAGIYGPNRIPRASDVVAGRPIESRENGYLNLIHVDDAARAVLASWEHPPHRLYVVADDLPVQRGNFYRLIAHQLVTSAPSFIVPASTSAKRFRSESNKRIWNRRMKRHLVNRLQFPTYREGLRDALADRHATR